MKILKYQVLFIKVYTFYFETINTDFLRFCRITVTVTKLWYDVSWQAITEHEVLKLFSLFNWSLKIIKTQRLSQENSCQSYGNKPNGYGNKPKT